MKYAIVTPTYSGHFKFITNYLKSFEQYVQDKEEIQIYFTINKSEDELFQKIILPYKDTCNIKVLYFDDLLQKQNITQSPDELLKRFGTYSFQTLKKLYTISEIEYDWCLILDSESMWVRPTVMCELFEQYIKDPYVVGSDIEKRKLQSRLFHQVVENVEYLLDCKFGKWYIETFSWFYNKQIVLELFNQHGSPYELVEKMRAFELRYGIEPPVGVMEGPLYYTYLYKNREKYNYRFIDILSECEKNLGEKNLSAYLDKFYKTYMGHAGIIEYAPMLLDVENVELIANLFKTNGFDIIRCEYSDAKNIDLQRVFMEKVNPYILAVSQNHWFGLNNDKNKIFRQMLYRSARSFVKSMYHIVKDNVKELRRRLSFTFKMTCLINEKMDFLINENRYHYDSLRNRLVVQQQQQLQLIYELISISNGNEPNISNEQLNQMKQELERYNFDDKWKYSN